MAHRRLRETHTQKMSYTVKVKENTTGRRRREKGTVCGSGERRGKRKIWRVDAPLAPHRQQALHSSGSGSEAMGHLQTTGP